MGKAKDLKNYQREVAIQGYENAIVDRYMQEYAAEQVRTLKNEAAVRQFDQNKEIADLQRLAQLDAFDRSQQRYVQQLSVNKQNAKLSIENQKNVLDDRVTAIKQQFDNLKTTYDYEVAQNKLDQRKNNATFADAISQYSIEQQSVEAQYSEAIKQVANGVRQANIEYKVNTLNNDKEDFQRKKAFQKLSIAREKQKTVEGLRDQELIQQKNAAVAKYNFANLASKISTTQSTGQLRARGTKGGTADRDMQAALAVAGLNQAQLYDQLTRSKEGIKLAELEQQASKKASKKTFKKEQQEYNKFSGKFADRRDKLQDKAFNVSMNQFINQVESIENQKTIGTNKIKTGKASSKEQYKIRQKELAKAIGVSTKRMNMNTKTLGKSLVSAVESTEVALTNIEQIRLGNDMQAYAATMMPPRMSGDVPAPFEAPKAKFVDPAIPIDPPKVPVGAPKPKSRSTLGTILGIGGAVLGVAGAVFTGGASLALAGGATTGFWAGGTAAALGTGLTGVGTGLGQIGGLV